MSDDKRPPLTGVPLDYAIAPRDLVDEIRDLDRPNEWESIMATLSTDGKRATFWDVSGTASKVTLWPRDGGA